MLGSGVIIIGYPPNLNAYDFVLQNFFKMIFPATLSTCLASCWPLGITTKMSHIFNKIYNIFTSPLESPLCASARIVTSFIDFIDTF